MNREDIIRIAQEAGISDSWDLNWQDKIIEHFAALVAKHTLANIDPTSFMSWQEGYEAGRQAEKKCSDCGQKLGDANHIHTCSPQSEQKSVAMADYMALTEKYVALKAAQRTWVGLTKDEVEILAYKAEGNTWKAVELAEAKLKEKNT